MLPVLALFLSIGTVLMAVPIAFVSRKYGISLWKGLIATILLTVFGTLGTFLLYYVENGGIGGTSFYGAVFFVPAAFALVALLLRIPYGRIMDLCAVGECIMLALMKVQCQIYGCCGGRLLFTTGDGVDVYFPSQIAELVVALALFTLLLCWALKGKHRGMLYPWYLVLYGSIRFVLNIFREAWVTKEMLLPFGNIWSLVAIAIGVIWFAICRKKRGPRLV